MRGIAIWRDEQSGDREVAAPEGDPFGLPTPHDVVVEREAQRPQSQEKKAGNDSSSSTKPFPTHFDRVYRKASVAGAFSWVGLHQNCEFPGWRTRIPQKCGVTPLLTEGDIRAPEVWWRVDIHDWRASPIGVPEPLPRSWTAAHGLSDALEPLPEAERPLSPADAEAAAVSLAGRTGARTEAPPSRHFGTTPRRSSAPAPGRRGTSVSAIAGRRARHSATLRLADQRDNADGTHETQATDSTGDRRVSR